MWLPFEDTSKNQYISLLLTSHCQNSLTWPHPAAWEVGYKLFSQSCNELSSELEALLLRKRRAQMLRDHQQPLPQCMNPVWALCHRWSDLYGTGSGRFLGLGKQGFLSLGPPSGCWWIFLGGNDTVRFGWCLKDWRERERKRKAPLLFQVSLCSFTTLYPPSDMVWVTF